MKLCAKMHRINYLFGEIGGAYHQVSVKLELSDSWVQVLYTLCDNGEVCPLADVYKLTGLPKQTVNSAVRGMEREGLLSLKRRSGREKDLVLTDKGRKLAEKTVYHLFQMENDVLSAWPSEDVQNYVRLMERFTRDFKKKAADFSAKPDNDKEGEKQI